MGHYDEYKKEINFLLEQRENLKERIEAHKRAIRMPIGSFQWEGALEASEIASLEKRLKEIEKRHNYLQLKIKISEYDYED